MRIIYHFFVVRQSKIKSVPKKEDGSLQSQDTWFKNESTNLTLADLTLFAALKST